MSKFVIFSLIIALVLVGCEKGKTPATPAVTPTNVEGEITIDYSFDGSALVIRNTSGRDLNSVMVSLDIYKGNSSDSTFFTRIDLLASGETARLLEWIKMAGGKSTENETLPGAGYIIKTLSVSCDEGDFWVDL
jgi:hypothetical protein